MSPGQPAISKKDKGVGPRTCRLNFVMIFLCASLDAYADPPAPIRALIGARGPCNSLTATWTPSFANIVEYFRLAGAIGSIANTTAIPATVGSSGTFSNANASVSPTTGYAQGFMDTGITFDGVDDYVNVPYTQTAVTAFTVSAWIKTVSPAIQLAIWNDRGNGAGLSLTFGMGTTGGGHGGAGKVGWEVDSNAIDIGISSAATVNDGNWHHVVGTWAAASGNAVAVAQFSIYIDGAGPVATTNGTTGATNSPLTGLGNSYIGYHNPWATHWPGAIEEVAVWNVQLSTAQVQNLYLMQKCNYR